MNKFIIKKLLYWQKFEDLFLLGALDDVSLAFILEISR